MKPFKFNKETYKPSNEFDRKAYEQRWNSHRLEDYRAKKTAQEALHGDWWEYIDNDKHYIELNGG